MNIRSSAIHPVMYEQEQRRLKGLLDNDDIWKVLKECNAIIAGGAITSMFNGSDVNDIDVYFRTEEDLLAACGAFIGDDDYDFDVDPFTLLCCGLTDKSILFQETCTGQHIQFIHYKFFSSVEEVFNSYDFTINMGAFSLATNCFILHPEFMKHNAQRYLKFNQGTDYPIMSLLRVDKYKEKGYKISKSEMLRIAFTIHQLELNSWEEAKDQLSGMYGVDVDNLFDEAQEFSVDTLIEGLERVSFNPNITTIKQTTKRDVESYIFQRKLKAKFKDGPAYFYKTVREKNGEFLPPIYQQSKIKYKEGEYVNGGEKGIFCVEDTDRIFFGGSHIATLRVEDFSSVNLGRGREITLQGDVFVEKIEPKSDNIVAMHNIRG